MNGLILPPTVKTQPVAQPDTCGSCRFGPVVAPGQVECKGVPPTPVVIGMGQNMAGQPAMQIELMRPRLAATEPGCALWKAKTLSDMIAEGNG